MDLKIKTKRKKDKKSGLSTDTVFPSRCFISFHCTAGQLQLPRELSIKCISGLRMQPAQNVRP